MAEHHWLVINVTDSSVINQKTTTKLWCLIYYWTIQYENIRLNMQTLINSDRKYYKRIIILEMFRNIRNMLNFHEKIISNSLSKKVEKIYDFACQSDILIRYVFLLLSKTLIKSIIHIYDFAFYLLLEMTVISFWYFL